MGCAVGVGSPNGHHPHHHFFFFAFLAVMLISGAAAGNGSLTSTGQRASRAAARAEHATGGGTFAGEENPSGTWEEDAAPWGGMGPGDGSGILPNLDPGGPYITYPRLDHGTGCNGQLPYCGKCIPCPSNPHPKRECNGPIYQCRNS